MMASVTQQCQFSAIISDQLIEHLGVTILETWTLQILRSQESPRTVDLSDGAFLQFSSGTTGMKRGVLIDDASALLQLATYANALHISNEDVVVGWLPLYHDMGLIADLVLPLTQGLHTVMISPLDWVSSPVVYFDAITRYRGSISWHPNFAFSFLADRIPNLSPKRIDLRSLRCLVNCSEPVTSDSQNRFLTRFSSHGLRTDVFCGCYAMAETVFALTHGKSNDPGYFDYLGPIPNSQIRGSFPLISVGKPLPGVTIEIVDDKKQILPDRHLGEIRVRSPYSFRSYYNNPEAAAQVITEHGYYTGDVGYFSLGSLFVTGRKKEMLIVAGINVWPQDLEHLCYQVEGIHAGRAVAFGTFDHETQTDRIFVLAESDAPPVSHQNIQTTIRQRILASFQISNFEVHIMPPGWLTKSSSGKIARLQNRDRWLLERAL
jgi:acyl-CoA synthetase (AMP-forming)/AMP-acid ligase II